MDIDKAFNMLRKAKAGNLVSMVVFNGWAEASNMPTYPDKSYDKVNTYDDFYNMAYMNIFVD